jgi:hypothetical protein
VWLKAMTILNCLHKIFDLLNTARREQGIVSLVCAESKFRHYKIIILVTSQLTVIFLVMLNGKKKF